MMKKKLSECFRYFELLFNKFKRLIKKNFVKFKTWKYYKSSLLLIITLLIIIIVLFTYFISRHKKYTDTFYQNILGEKFEYQATYQYESDVVKDFNIKEYDMDYTISPIYFKEKNKILFGEDASLILLNDYQQYYLGNNFIIKKREDNYLIKGKKYIDFIIFNGDNLFFFSGISKLYVNNQEIELGASSYCLLWNDTNIEYYNSTTQTSELIEFTGNPYVQINDQKINLQYKSVLINDKEYLFQTDVKKLTEVGVIDG